MARLTIIPGNYSPPPHSLLLSAWPVAAHENIIEYDTRERESGREKKRATFSAVMILLLFSSRPEQNVAYTQRRHCVYYVIDTIL